MKQIVLIHGGSDFRTYEEFIAQLKSEPVDITEFQPKQRWKNTFAEHLGSDYQVLRPQMPNPENAHYEEWKIWFEKMVPFLIDGVILIGHSLGGIFLAKYLSENTLPKKIGATILISAPYDSDGLDPPLGDFILTKPLEMLAQQSLAIYLVHAEDDPIVPFSHAQKYLAQLPSAKLVALKGGGHSNQPEFLELIELIHGL